MKFKIKKQMISFICILIGSLITIIAAFFEYKNKLEEKEESLKIEQKRNAEYESIIRKNNDIIIGQTVAINASSKIIELQNELNQKNNQLQKLQNITLNAISGGKSVPKILIIVTSFGMRFNIINDSNLPVRNVTIGVKRRVYDYYLDRNTLGPQIPNSKDAIKNVEFSVGDLQINSNREIYNEEFIKQYYDFLYTYKVKWENGYYISEFNFKVVNNKYIIENQNISVYSEGLNLKKASSVNGIYSIVVP